MPWYEYHCPTCGKDCELSASIAERDEQRCPSCGKDALQRAMSDFAVGNSEAASQPPMPQCPGGQCLGGQCPMMNQ